MAQASKKVRKERRLRRALSIAERNIMLTQRLAVMEQFIKQAQQTEFYARTTLLGVLAQNSGEVEVTLGTQKQVLDNIKELSWTVHPKKGDDQTMVIQLVEGQAEATELSSIEMTGDNEAEASDAEGHSAEAPRAISAGTDSEASDQV